MTKRRRNRITPGKIRGLLKTVRFSSHGLIPAVIQDSKSRKVLTLCYLNREALAESLTTGNVHVYRRSQRRLMKKGETSGHTQAIRKVYVDCEGRSLLFLVKQQVAACHAGYFSCYFRRLTPAGGFRRDTRRIFNPARVYK